MIPVVQARLGNPSAKAAISATKDLKLKNAVAPRDQNEGPPPNLPPLGKVRIRQPHAQEVSDYEDFPGRTVAARQVELRARVSGPLMLVACWPGQIVKQEELLFAIDPRPYRAELDRAKAELKRAQARRTRWQNELARVKRQAESHAIGQAEVNRVEGELIEAAASVKVAEAASDLSNLNLGFTQVRAPFAGTVSGHVLELGDAAIADTTPLATIVSMDPMFVAFDVDQRTVLHLNRLRHEGKIKGGSWLGVSVAVGLPDEEDFPRRSKIDSVDIRIDAATGMARWRAAIPNSDGLVLPGMFVRVRLVTSTPYKALLVPEQAVMTDGYRKNVLVVTSQNIVQRRPVKTGRVYNGLRLVEGLQADEWVVIDQPGRIREGTKVITEKVPPVESSPRVPSSR
jgi:RND family efflux transporter MFP subunit